MASSTQTRQQGRVKKWFAGKGFGFIARTGERDLFVHVSALSSDLRRLADGGQLEGTEVTFTVTETPKGLAAAGVERLGAAETRSADSSAPESQRCFAFHTKSSVQNEFRGRASDPMLLPDDLREKAKSAYIGLFDDAEGRGPVDRHGHEGFMAEWRLQQMVRQSPQKRDLAFVLPGSESTWGCTWVSAAGLVRHLDGLSPDQCPVCRKELPEGDGSFSGKRHCSCGYWEFGDPKPTSPLQQREEPEPASSAPVRRIVVRVKDLPKGTNDLLVHRQQVEVPEELLEPGQKLSGEYGILDITKRPDLEGLNADSWGFSLGAGVCPACGKFSITARRKWRYRVTSHRSAEGSKWVALECVHCGALLLDPTAWD